MKEKNFSSFLFCKFDLGYATSIGLAQRWILIIVCVMCGMCHVLKVAFGTTLQNRKPQMLCEPIAATIILILIRS